MEQYCGLNGHVVGIILKELVRRAIVIARRQTFSFEVSKKMGYGGDMNDVFTTADTHVQESYVKLLRECFPDIGIIGEEGSLVISANGEVAAYFTIDPIDGTKAYIRRQSHGIGSMIALVINGVVVSAYIGDVNSQEIFGYRPGSSSVWRITDLEVFEKLNAHPPDKKGVNELHLLLRERENMHCLVSRKTMNVFKSISIDGGSIGIWAARLWKGEVGGLLLTPSWETPWDSSPVIGISQRLGFVFLKPYEKGWRIYEPMVSAQKYKRTHDTMIIHRNHVPLLREIITVKE